MKILNSWAVEGDFEDVLRTFPLDVNDEKRQSLLEVIRQIEQFISEASSAYMTQADAMTKKKIKIICDGLMELHEVLMNGLDSN